MSFGRKKTSKGGGLKYFAAEEEWELKGLLGEDMPTGRSLTGMEVEEKEKSKIKKQHAVPPCIQPGQVEQKRINAEGYFPPKPKQPTKKLNLFNLFSACVPKDKQKTLPTFYTIGSPDTVTTDAIFANAKSAKNQKRENKSKSAPSLMDYKDSEFKQYLSEQEAKIVTRMKK